jgi:hypothetical protein
LNVSAKDVNFSLLGKYILKIHPSNKDLDYMIQKGMSQTSMPKHKYIYFRKEITNPRDLLFGVLISKYQPSVTTEIS